MQIKIIFHLIIFVCSIVCNAKLTIHGNLPTNYQLLEMLMATPAKQLHGYHYLWIDKIVESILEHKDNHEFKNKEIRAQFDRNDAREILRPILINQICLNDELIETLFLETIQIDRETYQKSDITYFTAEEVKAELFAAALKTIEIAKGHLLLVIGQTPAYLGCMIKEINNCLSHDQKIQIINVPLSGKPDVILPRFEHQVFNKTDKWSHWSAESYKEIVTRSREQFFRQKLTDLGFSPKTIDGSKKIFILDNSRGPSIASLLLLLVRWLEDYKKTIPDFSFIAMDSAWYKPDFRMNENLYFEIDTYFLGIDDQLLNHHLDTIKDNLRIQPPFQAYLWRSGLESFFSQYPRPEAKALMEEYHKYCRNQLIFDKSNN